MSAPDGHDGHDGQTSAHGGHGGEQQSGQSPSTEAEAAAVAEVEGAAQGAGTAAGTGTGTGTGTTAGTSRPQTPPAAATPAKPGSRIHQLEPDERSPLAALNNVISANFRRALFASLLACAGLGLTYISGGVLNTDTARVAFFTKHAGLGQVTAIVGAIAFLVFGVVAVRSATKEILKTVPPGLGDNRKNALRWVCLLVGYLVVIFGTLGALNVPIERLLVGGAVTGVILGIAAQQSLGNLFAGLMLLLTRPFAIGDEIALRSGPLGGVLTGLVADMNLTYVKLVTDGGTILLPNSTILTAVVGPPGAFD